MGKREKTSIELYQFVRDQKFRDDIINNLLFNMYLATVFYVFYVKIHCCI